MQCNRGGLVRGGGGSGGGGEEGLSSLTEWLTVCLTAWLK